LGHSLLSIEPYPVWNVSLEVVVRIIDAHINKSFLYRKILTIISCCRNRLFIISPAIFWGIFLQKTYVLPEGNLKWVRFKEYRM
jgi:hypothetical protein